jgi:5-methylcytosine-specific restriction endonuclease McrBC GTP-binding regulatory subunit McrB
VFVTGTVNVDESTYMFSPKVLDRANVIEFNEVFLDGRGSGSLADSFVLEDPDCRRLFLSGHRAFASHADFEEIKGDVREPLQGLIDILKPYHLHFGYRTINEISRFVSLANGTVHSFSAHEALDIQFVQKILPKFHGTRARMEKPLSRILLFCYRDRDVGEKEAVDKAANLRAKAEGFDPDAQYRRCAQKCARMLRTLKEQGYTSSIE